MGTSRNRQPRRAATLLVVLSAVACNLDLKPFVEAAPDGGGFVPTPVRDAEPEPDAFVIDPPPRDAAPDGTDGGRRKRVFVTSAGTTGALGGVGGADARCQQLATRAKLDGTFVAWLSVEEGPALARLRVDGPWFLLGGTRVFASKAAIAMGPEVPIDRDENNVRVDAADVWTGTNGAGNATAQNCNGWVLAVGSGTKGKTNGRGNEWTASDNDNCQNVERLYCFEQ